MTATATGTGTGTRTARWSRAERWRLSGVVGVIALLHLVGWSLFLALAAGPLGAGLFAGAGVLAYVLGIRHAFDADHIAAIDDTTRLMVQRGRRPVGVGFFFAMGHSSVVVVLSLVVAIVAGAAGSAQFDQFRVVGGAVSTVVAMVFLALVAALNATVLVGIVGLWRDMRRGRLDEAEMERRLLERGLVNRLLGGRAQVWIKHSWHMFPLGVLFGLGLETASEVTLLTLSATTAAGAGATAGAPSLLAALTLPLLFAAGMSAFDTADGLLMSVAYSWSNRRPARRLFYNIATTAATVLVAAFVSAVYLAGVLSDDLGITAVAGFAALAEDFETLGYVVVGIFVVVWGGAALVWRLGGLDRRYGVSPTTANPEPETSAT